MICKKISIYRFFVPLLIKNLQGGKQLTPEEINEHFKQNNTVANRNRLSYIMMYAEPEEIIYRCDKFNPPISKQGIEVV